MKDLALGNLLTNSKKWLPTLSKEIKNQKEHKSYETSANVLKTVDTFVIIATAAKSV